MEREYAKCFKGESRDCFLSVSLNLVSIPVIALQKKKRPGLHMKGNCRRVFRLIDVDQNKLIVFAFELTIREKKIHTSNPRVLLH